MHSTHHTLHTNSSPFLSPPEVMDSLNDEFWLEPNPSYSQGSSVDWSKIHCDTSDPEHQRLDHLATWQLPSCSSINIHRSFGGLCEQSSMPLADVPDLSHTPFSCDSNVSSSGSLPLDSYSDDDYACYAPDLDALGSIVFDPSSSCHPPDFSLSSFPCIDSIDKASTIHSPKPVFAYKTFDFNFDRPHSPDAAVDLPCSGRIVMSRHKRRHEEENGFEDIITPKRRKMSGEAPGLLSLFPDPYRDLASGWNPCSPVDTSYPKNDSFSMEQLLNCTFDWGDAWPKSPGC